MLGEMDAVPTIAVRDLAVAKAFYSGTLGLTQVAPEDMGVLVYKSGDSKMFVYQSRYAGTNKATATTWTVGDNLEELVQDLKTRGVEFERYDMPNMRHEGDVHVMGKTKAAWFKDPDGNILSIVNG